MKRSRRPMTARLSALRDRMEGWRRTRGGKRTRIPEELWSAAVDVARAEGVYPTSKALRLDYYDLKGRVDRAGQPGVTTSPAFVELEPVMKLSGTGKAVLELEGPRGDRMRIEVTGMSTVDVATLARTIWSGER